MSDVELYDMSDVYHSEDRYYVTHDDYATVLARAEAAEAKVTVMLETEFAVSATEPDETGRVSIRLNDVEFYSYRASEDALSATRRAEAAESALARVTAEVEAWRVLREDIDSVANDLAWRASGGERESALRLLASPLLRGGK